MERRYSNVTPGKRRRASWHYQAQMILTSVFLGGGMISVGWLNEGLTPIGLSPLAWTGVVLLIGARIASRKSAPGFHLCYGAIAAFVVQVGWRFLNSPVGEARTVGGTVIGLVLAFILTKTLLDYQNRIEEEALEELREKFASGGA